MTTLADTWLAIREDAMEEGTLAPRRTRPTCTPSHDDQGRGSRTPVSDRDHAEGA